MTDESERTRRSVLAAVGAGGIGGLAGCGGVLGGGGPTYECLALTARRTSGFLAYDYEIEYSQVGESRETVNGSSSGSSQVRFHEYPEGCRAEGFDPADEHPAITTPIRATVEVDSDSDVSQDSPIVFGINLDGEALDAARANGPTATIELTHDP